MTLDKILPSYNDPLFSILVITLLVLVVAIVSIIMGNYKEEKQKKSLQIFLGKLNRDDCTLDIEKLPFESTIITPLSLLANTFSIQGEYQKSINIYLYLIEHIQPFFEKEHLLEGLGETYLKAGFLKRAEDIFLEILHKRARNINALYHLEIVYELLREYDKAKETLQPLEIMGEDIKALEAHLELITILNNSKIKREDKIEKLNYFLNSNAYSYRRIIQELFKLDLDSAWRAIDSSKIYSILDILWFLPLSNLNFDIIYSDKILSSIYSAKGILDIPKRVTQSGIFAIDTINYARIGGSSDVDLIFSYGCSRCKQNFPIPFERCPNCYAINSIQIHQTITQKRSQTGYSLL